MRCGFCRALDGCAQKNLKRTLFCPTNFDATCSLSSIFEVECFFWAPHTFWALSPPLAMQQKARQRALQDVPLAVSSSPIALAVSPLPSGKRFETRRSSVKSFHCPFLASLHPVGNSPTWFLPMPISTDLERPAHNIEARFSSPLLVWTTHVVQCNHRHSQGDVLGGVRRNVGFVWRLSRRVGPANESTLSESDMFFVVGGVGFSCHVRTSTSAMTSIFLLDNNNPDFGDLCRMVPETNRRGGFLAHRDLKGPMPRKPWFSTLDGTNIEDASKHLRFVSASMNTSWMTSSSRLSNKRNPASTNCQGSRSTCWEGT